MKKINLKLYAGLGNQLFQLSMAIFVAKKFSYDHIAINNEYCVENQRHNYLTSLFDVSKLCNSLSSKSSLISRLRLPKILSFRYSFNPLVSDKNIEFLLARESSNLSLYLDGYFIVSHTQKIFSETFNLIKDSYKYKNEDYCVPVNSCTIHVRGTDFLKLGWNSVCPKDYYAKAVQIMRNNKIVSFKVVTDDAHYAEKFIKDLDIDAEILMGSVVDDFNLITHSKNRVLSSSTFAFWAAAIGSDLHNQNGLTIAPSLWTPDLPRAIRLSNEINIKPY